MIILGVIPARWSSSRFPGKPLAKIKGKPMIQWVWENASRAKLLNDLIVATDDKRIFNAVMQFWGTTVMTSPKHKSGTDRVGEIAKERNCEIAVNIQGDEPFINPENIDSVINALVKDKNADVSTLACRIKDKKELDDPNVVKVIFDKKHYAIDFSRRQGGAKHIGLYAYRKDYLMKFIKMKQSKREKEENLEQLRILDSGGKIKVVITKKDSVSIDTKDDLKRF